MAEGRHGHTVSGSDPALIPAVEAELRAMLAVAPSPAYQAGIRRRVDGLTPRPGWVARMPSVAAGVGVVVACVAIGMGLAGPWWPIPPTPDAAGPPLEAIRLGDVAALLPIPAGLATPVAHPRAATPTAPATRVRPDEVEVIVPPGQMDIIRRYVERFRASPVRAVPLQVTSVRVPAPSDYDALGIVTPVLDEAPGSANRASLVSKH